MGISHIIMPRHADWLTATDSILSYIFPALIVLVLLGPKSTTICCASIFLEQAILVTRKRPFGIEVNAETASAISLTWSFHCPFECRASIMIHHRVPHGRLSTPQIAFYLLRSLLRVPTCYHGYQRSAPSAATRKRIHYQCHIMLLLKFAEGARFVLPSKRYSCLQAEVSPQGRGNGIARA